MRITFDPDFDGGAWPGPLAGRGAVFGEAWLGPLGLVALLESQLGLAAPWPGDVERAAALVPALGTVDGAFWERSAGSDAFGVARTLLAWRDGLAMAGWDGTVPAGGGPATLRLAQLAGLARGIEPGMPDRLAAVARALVGAGPVVAQVELLEPLPHLPARWREVLTALERAGTRVVERRLEPAPAAPGAANLAAARASGFHPRPGDDSLVLYRPPGILEGADAIAATLAALDTLDSVVLVGGDRVLDAALHRHGLPATGAGSRTDDDALLEILPLVLALGWSPADPARAHELLTLPASPVPPAIGGGLARALAEWPAIDSDTWRHELAGGLERIAGTEDRRRVAERLAVLFAPAAERTRDGAAGYPVAAIHRRVDALRRWLRGRLAHADDPAPWRAADAQCGALLRLLDRSGQRHLPPAQLRRAIDDATAEVPRMPLFPAQAGLPAVARPEAVAGPARRVVWWDFDAEGARLPRPLPVARAERAALERLGVHLPDPEHAAEQAARRWRRPLEQARSQLLLVCPERGGDGEERFPHPLWDEITASLALAERSFRFGRNDPGPPALPRVARTPVPPPRPRRAWRVPAGAVAGPGRESASSLASLLGCGFAWAVGRAARVSPGGAAPLLDAHDERLVGRLAHEILARVLKAHAAGELAAEAAEERAARLFHSEGPRLAAPIFLPGADVVRAEALRATTAAARRLVEWLVGQRRTVLAVEQAIVVDAPAGRLEGRPDLVIGPKPAVIDLKWGGEGHRLGGLGEGAALQLATYAHLLRASPLAGGAPATVTPVGYFFLRSQRLAGAPGADFPAAEAIDAPPPERTWRAMELAAAQARAQLAAGDVAAAGNPSPDTAPVQRSRLTDDGIEVEPPCRWCDYAVLCGHALVAEEEA